VLDGELVASDDGDQPDFPLVCERVLHRHSAIALTYVVFDLLSVERRDVTREPYAERRRILEQDAPRRSALADAGGVRRRRGALGCGVRARA
jgi:ATP-dependent DNA ligase